MDFDKKKQIEQAASEFAQNFFNNIANGHPDEITTDWLLSKHPDLDPDLAEEYRLFCKSNTIVFKGCYGDGEIMWPKWQKMRYKMAPPGIDPLFLPYK